MNMEPNSEPITVAAASISGTEVIEDLCARIADKLSRSGDLRPTDAYRTYSAKITIELQLVDIDQIEIAEQMVIGTPDPEQPSEHITVAIPEKRYYTPRNRTAT
jgi:hypothetical protein